MTATPQTSAAVDVGKPDRPTCPRCGKTFRRSGAGLDWHLANRPDCAEARNVPRASGGADAGPGAT